MSLSAQKIMLNTARTTKLVLSDGQLPREKFEDGVTSGDANFSNEAKNGFEKYTPYFLDCESDPEDKYSGDEAGEFGTTNNRKLKQKSTFYPDFTTEPQSEYDSESCSDSDSELDSDSDSAPSLKHVDFADNEIEIQVDRLTFYKHQKNVTRKTWTVFRPETKRLAYVPFLAHSNGKSSLAHISTKLLFVKQPYFEHSIYLSFLSIHNESDNFTSYLVKCSNPKKLKVQPSLGFIKPRGSVKVSFSSDQTFAYEFYELLYESVTVYVAPFKIMESDEKKIVMVENRTPEQDIGLFHMEDFWRSYGTPWFPKAEIHYIKDFIPSDPSFSERSISMGLKACIRDIRRSISGMFCIKSRDNSYSSKGEELIGQSQVHKAMNSDKYFRLECAFMELKKSFKIDQDIWKLCKIVLCSIGLYLVITHHDAPLTIVFGFQEPQQSIMSWSWWTNTFENLKPRWF